MHNDKNVFVHDKLLNDNSKKTNNRKHKKNNGCQIQWVMMTVAFLSVIALLVYSIYLNYSSHSMLERYVVDNAANAPHQDMNICNLYLECKNNNTVYKTDCLSLSSEKNPVFAQQLNNNSFPIPNLSELKKIIVGPVSLISSTIQEAVWNFFSNQVDQSKNKYFNQTIQSTVDDLLYPPISYIYSKSNELDHFVPCSRIG